MKKEKFHEFEKRKKEKKTRRKKTCTLSCLLNCPGGCRVALERRPSRFETQLSRSFCCLENKKIENGPAQCDKGGMRPLVETTVAGA